MSGIIEFLSSFFRLALGDVIVKVQLVLCFFFQKIRYFSYCKFCETYTTSRNANVKVLKYFPQQKRNLNVMKYFLGKERQDVSHISTNVFLLRKVPFFKEFV